MEQIEQNMNVGGKPRTSPKDFFLHLAAMVTLYVSSSSILMLLFQIINISFPDALENFQYYYYDPYTGAIRWAIASLIVLFPLYLILMNVLNKNYINNPDKKNLGVRKWLIYLTLFVTGAIIVGDLIFLLNTFLGGEITVRFILKTISVFFVFGLIFTYYIRDIRSQNALQVGERRFFRYGTSAFVLLAIIAGFVIMGSPVSQRLLRFDIQKVNDLQNIQGQVTQYWQQKGQLPLKLDDLNDSLSYYGSTPKDPQNKESYEYIKNTELTFELCANFNVENNKDDTNIRATYPKMDGDTNWKHDKGRYCFKRTIDPERYPTTKISI